MSKATRHSPMSDPFDNLLSRLQGLKPNGPNSFMALCPAHNDKSPSLAITQTDDGRVIFHCHAGCGPVEVLDSIDFRFQDLYPQSNLTSEQRKAYKRQKTKQEIQEALISEMLTLLQVLNDRAASRKLSRDSKFKKRHPEWTPYPQEHWDREPVIAKRIQKGLKALYE